MNMRIFLLLKKPRSRFSHRVQVMVLLFISNMKLSIISGLELLSNWSWLLLRPKLWKSTLGKREIVVLRYLSASVEIVDWGDGTAEMRRFFAQERQQGHGSKLMELVEAYADSNDLIMHLQVGQYGARDGLNDIQLIEFYKRYGFIISNPRQNNRPIMQRPLVEEVSNG